MSDSNEKEHEMRTIKRHIAAAGTVLGVLMAGAAFGGGKGDAAKRKPVKPQEVNVSVTEAGFVPATLEIRKGVPTVLVITRRTDRTCARQAVFASLEKSIDLPLNQAVRIELPAQSKGKLSYACSMDMLRGELVIR